jgi:hypothetical protein
VDYTRCFESSCDVQESHIGGKMRFDKLAEADQAWSATDVMKQNACYECAYNRCMSLLLLQNSNQAKYGSILTGLASQFALTQDQYPKTLTHTVSILSDSKYNP